MEPQPSSPLLQNQAPLGIKLAGASGDIKSAKGVSSTKLRDTPYVPYPLDKGLSSPRRGSSLLYCLSDGKSAK
ncbi:MAG: hypothetical protein P8P32_03520 [Akkermansiaceae bacterium]|nr:hypothetical protein [Akkermansiaceae bacterium]MDG2324876.1 hypothetical protein [Akkermansiaceae bacterium]